jgi:flavin reductase (DIM6/NTAB) family NADH-FMN oxidoreductase RutF
MSFGDSARNPTPADGAPPGGEDEGLEFDLQSLDPRARYFLLTSVVVPRPIAWVSSVDRQGNRNLAPYSYFNACSATPPIVHFTSTAPKHSIANVRETGEFVVNIVSAELAQAMRTTSATFAAGEDEFKWAGVSAAPSLRVRPPRVREAKVALECRLRKLLEMGEGTIAFGDVLHVHVDRSVWKEGRVDPRLLAPVGRLSGTSYTSVTDVYQLDIPEQIKQHVEDYRIQGGPAGP